jgi:hypothetical protein
MNLERSTVAPRNEKTRNGYDSLPVDQAIIRPGEDCSTAATQQEFYYDHFATQHNLVFILQPIFYRYSIDIPRDILSKSKYRRNRQKPPATTSMAPLNPPGRPG